MKRLRTKHYKLQLCNFEKNAFAEMKSKMTEIKNAKHGFNKGLDMGESKWGQLKRNLYLNISQ